MIIENGHIEVKRKVAGGIDGNGYPAAPSFHYGRPVRCQWTANSFSWKGRTGAYNREYGDYMQKRIAIQNEMQREIEKATTEGERKTAEAKGNQALQELDFEQFKKI